MGKKSDLNFLTTVLLLHVFEGFLVFPGQATNPWLVLGYVRLDRLTKFTHEARQVTEELLDIVLVDPDLVIARRFYPLLYLRSGGW